MKLIINEKQFNKLNKTINELSPKSSGVEDFILDGTQKEFEELKKEMKEFLKNKEKSK